MAGWLRAIGRALGMGRSTAAPAAVPLRGRYDSAQSTDENARIFAMTDNLSAKAANSYQVRRVLRSRSRQEVANSSFARGIVDTTVNDLIGVGPTPEPDCGRGAAANEQILGAWLDWWAAVGGVEKLTTAAKAKRTDGEGFLILTNYHRVDNPVQLYPRDLECDQVTTPGVGYGDTLWVDGMTLDKIGNPISYDVLDAHPGDYYYANLNPMSFKTIAARHVIHWFRKDRPGQVRGIPELTPSLELFGQLRSFTKSVLSAARWAASISGVLETDFPANSDINSPENQANAALPFDQISLDNNTVVATPYGAKLRQMKAEQPVATYEMFQYCLMGEACRCINVPLNVALGTSQKFNFSSARLDHTNYRAMLKVERAQCETVVLNRLWRAWLEEAIMIPGLLPDGLSPEAVKVTWHWPGWAYLDPLKDAQADSERMGNGTATRAELAAEDGKDWRVRMRQRAIERAYQKELEEEFGLPPEHEAPTLTKPAQQEEEDSDAQEKAQAAAAA